MFSNIALVGSFLLVDFLSNGGGSFGCSTGGLISGGSSGGRTKSRSGGRAFEDRSWSRVVNIGVCFDWTGTEGKSKSLYILLTLVKPATCFHCAKVLSFVSIVSKNSSCWKCNWGDTLPVWRLSTFETNLEWRGEFSRYKPSWHLGFHLGTFLHFVILFLSNIPGIQKCGK